MFSQQPRTDFQSSKRETLRLHLLVNPRGQLLAKLLQEIRVHGSAVYGLVLNRGVGENKRNQQVIETRRCQEFVKDSR